MRRRIAHLPLHGGQAPAWLFQRMHRLAGSITQLIISDRGPAKMLDRLADPFWFQAFGCVLGFDWHSSGLTTVTCGALKEAYRRMGPDLGIHVAGGKGGTSRKTPDQIARAADKHSLQGDRLIYASRMSAKVDSAAVQDGYQIYSHHFFYNDDNEWCVVQQGMNDANGYARRYHWLGSTIDDFVCEPHNAVASPPTDTLLLLNMVARSADQSRKASAELTRIAPDRLLREITTGESLFMPAHHPVKSADINPQRLHKILRVTHERQPADFEGLLGVTGVGPKTVRSLALIAELIYGIPACKEDITRRWSPADPPTFSYAHGGKDGHPFPVDRKTYDDSIALLESAVRRAKCDPAGKDQALFRLSSWLSRE
ncbi:MAG: DUF763 domain-containing protein [Planctomycetota bacterium]|nr:MAG: DUF763 domain-containing protein [Planctomycetota bacterium]